MLRPGAKWLTSLRLLRGCSVEVQELQWVFHVQGSSVPTWHMTRRFQSRLCRFTRTLTPYATTLLAIKRLPWWTTLVGQDERLIFPCFMGTTKLDHDSYRHFMTMNVAIFRDTAPCIAMWTDVSEERITSIFRSLGPCYVLVSCSIDFRPWRWRWCIPLKRTARRYYIPEDADIPNYRCENLSSRKFVTKFWDFCRRLFWIVTPCSLVGRYRRLAGNTQSE
jgi:hypothetical protein